MLLLIITDNSVARPEDGLVDYPKLAHLVNWRCNRLPHVSIDPVQCPDDLHPVKGTVIQNVNVQALMQVSQSVSFISLIRTHIQMKFIIYSATLLDINMGCPPAVDPCSDVLCVGYQYNSSTSCRSLRS